MERALHDHARQGHFFFFRHERDAHAVTRREQEEMEQKAEDTRVDGPTVMPPERATGAGHEAIRAVIESYRCPSGCAVDIPDTTAGYCPQCYEELLVVVNLPPVRVSGFPKLIARLGDLVTPPRHAWTRRSGTKDVYECPRCGMWTANLPLYRNDECSGPVVPAPAAESCPRALPADPSVLAPPRAGGDAILEEAHLGDLLLCQQILAADMTVQPDTAPLPTPNWSIPTGTVAFALYGAIQELRSRREATAQAEARAKELEAESAKALALITGDLVVDREWKNETLYQAITIVLNSLFFRRKAHKEAEARAARLADEITDLGLVKDAALVRAARAEQERDALFERATAESDLVNQQAQEIATLRSALRQYGQHGAMCLIHCLLSKAPLARRCGMGTLGCLVKHGPAMKCTCGFADLLRITKDGRHEG